MFLLYLLPFLCNVTIICGNGFAAGREVMFDKLKSGLRFTQKELVVVENIDKLMKPFFVEQAKKVQEKSTLAQPELDNQHLDDSVCDSETLDEIDLISNKESSFLYKNKPITYAGSVFLSYLFADQTADPAVLKSRGQLIGYLQQNPDIRKQLMKLLETIKENNFESLVSNFLNDTTESQMNTLSNLFWNRSNRLLPDTIMYKIIPQGFIDYYARSASNYPNLFGALTTVAHATTFFWPNLLGWASVVGKYDPNLVGTIYSLLFEECQKIPKLRGIAKARRISSLLGGGLYITACLFIPDFYFLFKSSRDYYSNSMSMKESFLIASDKIGTALDEFKRFSLPGIKTLHPRCDVSQGLDKNIRYWSSSQFVPYNFLRYALFGDSLAQYYKLLRDKEKVLPQIGNILMYIGILDAYCCLAENLTQGRYIQMNDEHYKDALQIHLKKFFHPNLANPVLNDLSFVKSNKHRFIFVSGPNASGKSALARGVVSNFVLRQTINYVAAQDALITLFDKIFVFANLSDQLGVASKFQMEKEKIRRLYNYAKTHPDKKVLVMIDEPLTSIDTDDAGRVMANIFEMFDKLSNVMVICVSNTKSLQKVPRVLHMGLETEQAPNGLFKSTYRWKEGSQYKNDVGAQFKQLFGNDYVEVASN